MRIILFLACLFAYAACVLPAIGQTNMFTYQGRLTDGAAAANGTYQMQFSMYDALTLGNQIGTTITHNSVAATNGTFSVQLDFSPATPFASGVDRWLEIAVRKVTDPPGFTTLSPRQQITSSPFAIRTQSAGLADGLSNLCVLCVTDGQVSAVAASKITGIVQVNQGGTGSATQSFVDLSTTQIVNGAKTFTNLNGSGSALTNLNPANISTGTAAININGMAAKAAVASAGATPSVADLTMLVLNYASPVAVTDLTGGIEGQCVILVTFNDKATITAAGNFKLMRNWSPLADETLTVCRTAASGTAFWYERSRAEAPKPALSVAKTGNGTGTVTSGPAGVNCGAVCSASYSPGTPVALTATPEPNSSFAGWSGACTGSGACNVTVNAATSVTANFSRVTFPVTVTRTGAGTVTSEPPGIYCGVDCSGTYDSGSTVTLTATPDPGLVVSWGGNCSGSGSTCILTMSSARTVTASFGFGLTVNKTTGDSGTGTVTSNPAGINCGSDCTENYSSGTLVELTATPAGNSTFVSWSGGGCTGTGTCQVTMDASKSVTARFDLLFFSLTVSIPSTSNGTVTSNPAGINCSSGSSCQASFVAGTPVTLTASPNSGSVFQGWTSCDSPSGVTCNLTMNSNKNVTANFSPPPATVTNVTSSTANGTYSTGATISIQVTFNSVVVVTGTPQLALNSGGTGVFGGGSGTSTLTFTYSVSPGENSADLDYTSTSALSGGSIQNFGSTSNLTLPMPGAAGSLGANKNIVIDTP